MTSQPYIPMTLSRRFITAVPIKVRTCAMICRAMTPMATVLWMYMLKHFPFSIAYPLSCLSYAFGMVAAILVFHEQVNWVQWIGVFLVMTGCVLIAR